MTYHIKLGDKTALRPYSLAQDGLGIVRQSANPFSAKLNVDQEYGDLEGWNEWVRDDWTEGIGHKNPEEGMLYARADTRFPNQAMLPLGLDYPDKEECIYSGNEYVAGDSTVASTAKLSSSLTAGSTGYSVAAIWVYLDAATGTTVTMTLEGDTGNKPDGNVKLTGTTVVTKYRPGPIWLRLGFVSNFTMTASTKYHITVTGDATLTVPKIALSGEYANTHSGASWSGTSHGMQYLVSFVSTDYILGLEADAAGDTVILEADDAGDTILLTGSGTSRIIHFAEASGVLYSVYGFDVRYWDESTSKWVAVQTQDTAIQSLISTGTEIHWSYGSGKSKVVPATSKTAVTDYTDDCDLLAVFKGLMYKSDDNNVYYSATGDDSSWSGPYAVGSDEYSIRGMAGLGDSLYISTDEALYQLAPGDFVVGVVPWPTISSVNGRNMRVWMSNLYIPLYEDLIQYSEGGGLLQVGLKRAEGLPDDIQGTVYHLHPTQYFLLATLEPDEVDSHGSIFAYNGEGWHHIATLPMNSYGGGMHVDAENNILWFGGDYGLTARINFPSGVLNPAKTNTTKLFARTGWIEYDWFYAGPVELLKDMESMFLFSEDTNSTSFFKVYWQDDGSTDWELLGTFTGNSQENRWTEYTPGSITRPETRRIKIGVLLRTDDKEATPLLRAMRLKFHTNVTDRWQWLLNIEVHDNQEMLGGGLNPYTSAQMQTHMTEMIQSVPPVIFEDIDGTQYEVKVASATVRPTKLEYIDDAKVIQWQYDVSLEAVSSGTYTG